ncbi:hypothetical protein ACWOFR_12120 [Carnobacterium gallinarum]|uniref:hypothetical protein n=1 Tax=Carnobacterium gallinarum TaxID=2749 RepID=UPI00068EEB4D|nr:hypothetical protein [Carnobacterium gallinarum]
MASSLNILKKEQLLEDFPFGEKSFYTIFLDDEEHQEVQAKKIYKSLISLFNEFHQEQPGYILQDPPFINYLTLLQNMLLAVTLAQPKLRSPELVVLDALEESQFSHKQAEKRIADFSPQQIKEIQLITNLCSQKQTVIIDDWLKDENDIQQKNWILILKSLVKQEQISVILVTSNPTIADMGEIQFNSDSFI